MQTYKGILKEIGQSITNPKSGLVGYSYLQVDDQIVKSLKGITGLSGKMEHELGKEITLYVENDYVVAFQSADGKTFSSQMEGTFLSILFMLLCIVSLWGIPFAFVGLKSYNKAKSFNAGAALPNAIQIPSL